jgi:hypothetical protein
MWSRVFFALAFREAELSAATIFDILEFLHFFVNAERKQRDTVDYGIPRQIETEGRIRPVDHGVDGEVESIDRHDDLLLLNFNTLHNIQLPSPARSIALRRGGSTEIGFM